MIEDLGYLNNLSVLTKFSKNLYYFISTVDHVHTMSLCQVRKIMDILSALAYNAPNAGQGLRDDLQMVIRKQITSSGKKLSLKQMGVIGAVATVKNMCKTSSVQSFNQPLGAGESSR